MDLRLPDARPTDAERDAVERVLGAPPSGWDGGERVVERDGRVAFGGQQTRARRRLLLPVLNGVQSRIGWISQGAVGHIAARLDVPPAEVWSVATFYGLLGTTPRPLKALHVCDDIACRRRGAAAVIEAMTATYGPPHAASRHGSGNDHPSAAERAAVWFPSPCLGLCDQAPAALLTVAGEDPVERLLGNVTGPSAVSALETGAATAPDRTQIPQRGQSDLKLLKRVGTVDPTSIDQYAASGGFDALRKAFEIGGPAVIREVTESRLMGRGGAAFPTGRKWDAVAGQPVRTRYVICNADESEPGTFKDRVLLEGDPFAIVEAIAIAAFAVGAEQGYVYIRGEYPLAIERIQGAIDQARARGFLGSNVLGRGATIEIEVRKGAGAYICGEETAIFNSIEGYRGEPRNKPPFPVQSGLFRKPTLVNNVETLANIPLIVLDGGQAFARIGTADSTGPKLFCVSGSVARPGVYEVSFGATLGDLIRLAGGISAGRAARAILLGGAAGGFVRGDELDIPLTFEGARKAQTTLGSGVIMVFDESDDLGDVLLRIAAFFRDESCGQCVPCRVGTVRQEEALHRLRRGKTLGGLPQEVALLGEIGAAMKDASICGLGQTAYSAVESAIKRGLFAVPEERRS